MYLLLALDNNTVTFQLRSNIITKFNFPKSEQLIYVKYYILIFKYR